MPDPTAVPGAGADRHAGPRRPGPHRCGLVGSRYAIAVALLTTLATAPVVVVLAAGQAALDHPGSPPAVSGHMPARGVDPMVAPPAGPAGTAHAGAPVVPISRADPPAPSPCP